MNRPLCIALLALAACTRREVQIDVAIPGPDSVEAPVAHLGVVALPYDRDSILAAIEAVHPRPVPLTRALDTLYQAYRQPFVLYAAAAYRVQTTERALNALKLRLDSLPRSGAAYDSLYRRYALSADSLTAIQRQRDRLQLDLASARNRLSPRIDSLRLLMAAWEDSTYRGYDSITKALGSGVGNEPIADSTGADGRLLLRLPPGSWWIYARSWDAWDPNSEWYWNVPVRGERVVLDRSSGHRRPRY